MVARMVELGALTPIPEHQPHTFLLPRYWQPETWYRVLHNTLLDMARAAACTSRVNPHGYGTPLRQRWCVSASVSQR